MIIRLVKIFNLFQNRLVSGQKLDFTEYAKMRDAILTLLNEVENESKTAVTCPHCKPINRDIVRNKPLGWGANARTRGKT
jgi:hypothetical protein